MTLIQTDAKNVERLAERAYCKDFVRMGMGSLTTHSQRQRTEPFRLSMVNTTYTVCRRYVERNSCRERNFFEPP